MVTDAIPDTNPSNSQPSRLSFSLTLEDKQSIVSQSGQRLCDFTSVCVCVCETVRPCANLCVCLPVLYVICAHVCVRTRLLCCPPR